MRKILLLVMFLAGPAVSEVESVTLDKKIICFKQEVLFKDLTEKYQEKPVLMGKSSISESAVAVYANAETGAYTLIEFNSTMACILSMGNNIKFKLPVTKFNY